MRLLSVILLGFLLTGFRVSADEGAKPSVFLIGDSTVKNGTRGQVGWGTALGGLFDATRIRIENRALGGRSTRSYLREGLWDEVLSELKEGDYVIIQFGHNDNGPFDEGRARASIKGNGEEIREITIKETGEKENVRSYGWYLRRYIADAKAKGATPIVCSLVPRNIWKKGMVVRATDDFSRWTREAAAQGGGEFIDLNALIADRYDAVGQDEVRAFFTDADHTHTSRAGAEFNASCVADGIRGLAGCGLAGFLSSGRTPLRVPDKVVVLTFDDAVVSHADYVGPLLKKFGFSATFFVCEFPDFADKEKYMTWEQIAGLHRMGFEIGSHTRSHTHVDKMRPPEFEAELDYIEGKCAEVGIPRPVTFAYPAYVHTPEAVRVLGQRGYALARAGGGKAFSPGEDDPRRIPSVSTTGTDEKAAERVLAALRQARDGKVVVLTLHGVPDTAHPHVTTSPELFERYLEFLRAGNYTVIALRDLAKYLPEP